MYDFPLSVVRISFKTQGEEGKPSLLGSQSTNPEFLLFAGLCHEQRVWGYQQMSVVPLHTELIKKTLN